MVYESIKDFLSRNKTLDNVNYCCCNIGSIEFAHNLILSAKNTNFPITFFALDKDSSDYMSNYCDVVNYYTGCKFKLPNTKNIDSEYCEWSTQSFNYINWCAWEIALEILNKGKSLIKLDTDIIVKRNFELELIDSLNADNFDFLFQEGGDGLCAGFSTIHFKSFEKLKNIFSHKTLKKYDYENIPDQRILRSMVKDKTINVKLLSNEKYPNGNYYYNNHVKLDTMCNIIHFNCVVGKHNKISQFKKFGYWYL